MKIGDVARAAGVSTSRIRFYEKNGIIPPAERGDNGYRDYPPELVATLGFIEQAQALGFTLREMAAVKVTPDAEHPISCEVALPLLRGKLGAVERLIAEAKDRKRRIEALIAELETKQVSEDIFDAA